MDVILAIFLILGLITLVNYLEHQGSPQLNTLIDWFFVLLNVPIVLMGVGFSAVGWWLPQLSADFTVQLPIPLTNFKALGPVVLLMGLCGMLVSVPPVRRLIAQRLPLNPDSSVHTLALVLSGLLVGNTLVTMTQGGLAQLAESAVSASLVDVLAQQLLFISLALTGVGWLIRRDSGKTAVRLGLERLTGLQLLIGLRWIILLVFLQTLAGAAWAALDPAQYEQFDGLNGQLLGGFDTVGEWLILALASGMGEELLFRGALQPVFGLTFTATLFAIAHVQYGLTPVTLVVFIIGIVLGYIRQRHNTTLCIFIHFGYNFTLGLLSLLAVYLETLAS